MLRWTVLTALLALACAGCEEAHEPHPDVKSVPQVMAAFKKFEVAWEKEDLEGAMALFRPNAVAFDPVPPGRFVGAQAIRGWIAGSFEALDDISITSTELRMHIAGPAAWHTAHYVFTAKQGGQPVRFEGDLTMTWLREDDDSWRISVFHASHVPSPVEAPAKTP